MANGAVRGDPGWRDRFATVEHRSQWEHAWAPYGADMTVRGPDAESPRG